jgi:hypothetical protein
MYNSDIPASSSSSPVTPSPSAIQAVSADLDRSDSVYEYFRGEPLRDIPLIPSPSDRAKASPKNPPPPTGALDAQVASLREEDKELERSHRVLASELKQISSRREAIQGCLSTAEDLEKKLQMLHRTNARPLTSYNMRS